MAKTKLKLKSSPHLRRVRSAVGRLSQEAVSAAEAIADFAEPPMLEFKSSQALEALLAGHGFKVTRPYRKMPTAFRASAGAGKPVIGILAEYDALPDCGRKPGQWGHGCGHNLLGTAAAVGGIVAAQVLSALKREGRVIVFGCPAEEALSGKIFMAAQRAFAGLDAVLAWHPSGNTIVNAGGGAAMDSIIFRFRGRTAHAAGGPHEGRSALDAAVLTDIAVNYLREHVWEHARMHSVITDGGTAPNVVPDTAEIWYFVRSNDRKQVDELRRRVRQCAQAAAMATGTRWRMNVQTAIAERIRNDRLAELLDALLHRCGAPKFTPGEARAAAKLLGGKKYATGIEPPRTAPGRGSSDEDNVSWFAPLGGFGVACVPKDTTGHHRDYAAAIRLAGAHRGMLKAAEVLAAAAVELALNAPLLRKAKAQFQRNRRGKKYDLPIRTDAVPGSYVQSSDR